MKKPIRYLGRSESTETTTEHSKKKTKQL